MNNMNELLDYNEICQREQTSPIMLNVTLDTAALFAAPAGKLQELQSEIESLESQKAQLLTDVQALTAYAAELRNSFDIIANSMKTVFKG